MSAVKAASSWLPKALYIDRGIVVVNKPPGLICQTVQTFNGEALQHQPEHGKKFREIVKEVRQKNQFAAKWPDFNDLLDDLMLKFRLGHRPYPVHRLDKPTTGVLVFAHTLPVARDLAQQFRLRTVHKTYLALVRGGEQSFSGTQGQIRAPLRLIDGRVSVSAAPAGSEGEAKMAATDWELVASSSRAPVSLLRFTPLTGFKHQLRVHSAEILRAPILGDAVHSSSKVHPRITKNTQLPQDRMYLHASHISVFRYRKSGGSKRFRLGITAPLPADFRKTCLDLGIRVDAAEAEGGLFIDNEPIQDGLRELDGKWLS